MVFRYSVLTICYHLPDSPPLPCSHPKDLIHFVTVLSQLSVNSVFIQSVMYSVYATHVVVAFPILRRCTHAHVTFTRGPRRRDARTLHVEG